MQTYVYRHGTTPMPITLEQDDGTPWDLSDATVVMRVQDGATCIDIPLHVPDPLLGVVVPDQAMLEALTPRARRAHLHVEWVDGTEEDAPAMVLHVMGGC